MKIGFRAGWPGLRASARRVRAGGSVLAVLAVAACAQISPPNADPFPRMAETEFDAAYSDIAERYVEPVSIGALALSGIEQVHAMDPAVAVVRAGDHLDLIARGRVVRSFRLPRDDNSGDWAAITAAILDSSRAASPAVRNMDSEQVYQLVFTGVLKGVDRFSRYANAVAARDLRAQRDGFGGIGVTLKQEGASVRIASVMDDTPAARGGIEAEDSILEIDGVAITGQALSDVIERLRGPAGATVKLTVASAKTNAPRELSLRRALIVPPTVSYAALGDIAYIRITGFNVRTTTSLDKALHKARREMGKALRGAVIDLRGNPGGLLDQAITVSNLFLTHGRILSTVGRHPDSNQTIDAAGDDVLAGLPVAVLVNGGTASAAEVVAAALQDQRRAVVVGTSSYGKGTVQTVHRLPNDGELTITWSRIHAPSGYLLNEVGVIPNVCTSKLEGDRREAVRQVIETVRSGRLDTMTARVELHRNGQPNKTETRLLRASCPAKMNAGDLDLEVARRLIEDGSLFARALQPSAPEIARWQ